MVLTLLYKFLIADDVDPEARKLIMKKLFVLFVLALTCMVYAAGAMAAPKKVAVFVEGNISREQKVIVNNAIMARLSGNREYRVFERSAEFLHALDREHDFEVSGMVSEDEIRAIGQRMGVDYVIAICATISSDNVCTMSARLIELTNCETLKTCNASREIEDSNTITALANNVAYRLLSNRSR